MSSLKRGPFYTVHWYSLNIWWMSLLKIINPWKAQVVIFPLVTSLWLYILTDGNPFFPSPPLVWISWYQPRLRASRAFMGQRSTFLQRGVWGVAAAWWVCWGRRHGCCWPLIEKRASCPLGNSNGIALCTEWRDGVWGTFSYYRLWTGTYESENGKGFRIFFFKHRSKNTKLILYFELFRFTLEAISP